MRGCSGTDETQIIKGVVRMLRTIILRTTGTFKVRSMGVA